MDGARFEVFTDDAGESRWRLKADNGEIVATGESHRDAADAERAVEGIVRLVVERAARVAQPVESIRDVVPIVRVAADGALGYSDDELKGTTE